MAACRYGKLPVRVVASVTAILALAFTLLHGMAARAGDEIVVLGTAPVAGVYYPAGGAVCRVVNAERSTQGLRCLIESTAGSAENLRRLEAGDIDFALLQSDWQYHAYRGSGGPGIDEPFVELRAVFSLHAQPLTIVMSRESGIRQLSDLRGKRINLGASGSATRAAGELLLQNLGWDDHAFADVMDLGLEEQVQALCDGQADAIVLPASHPNGAVTAATEGCLARLLPIDGPGVKTLLAERPYYARAVIPGGLYRGNPEPTPSFGVRATLVTRAEVSPETVYKFVASVFGHLRDLRAQHPALSGLAAKDMIEGGNTAPLHEGAAIYFKERGLM